MAALDKLIAELSRLPGLGEKSAQRITFFLLKTKTNLCEDLSQALLDVKAQVHNCTRCFNYTDSDVCAICKDANRSDEVVCVVEEPSDIIRIEETSGGFKLKYHVLQGVLSPLDGIGPDQLRIKELIERLKEEPIKEVVLALRADIEGDATCVYLTKLIRSYNIKVTRIAHGVPIGGHLDYIDARTLGRAIENRIELK
ncbi:MAG: recombination protein RecR [Oligoflexia bacterium]|nr:recombination protein RecR [Oligoflexia bacterium]